MRFFGELSMFEVLVAFVSFATGAYTVYKSFLEKAKLTAHPGDRMDLVISGGGGCRKFQLRAALTNGGVKMAVLQRMEARITAPSGVIQDFQWRLFFEYVEGGTAVQPAGEPHAIAVGGKGTERMFCEFELVGEAPAPTWAVGAYSVELLGWVDRRDREERANLRRTFHFSLDEVAGIRLATHRPAGPDLLTVPIAEWRYQEVVPHRGRFRWGWHRKP